MKIASIISYSSYHNAYIERCVKEAKKVSDYVIVMSHNCLYDGTDDYDNLIKAPNGADHSVVNFEAGKEARWYHNDLRRQGYNITTEIDDFDAVFFIDSDEILEGDKVKKWLETIEPDTDHKLAHLWSYRDTCYVATTPEEGAVLVSTKTLNGPDMNWFGDRERENFSKNFNYMANYQGKALGVHYSWAGTKEMILRKVSAWGHNRDTDWKAMVEAEYSHPFNYTCPFKPYKFIKVEPYVGFTFNE